MRSNFIFPRVDLDDMTQAEINQYIKNEEKACRQDEGWKIANKFFKDEFGRSAILTPGQTAIFNLITGREHRFSQILASTQWGKTLTISRAILMRIATEPEDWLIVVPDHKRGKIIINYILKATADHEYFREKLMSKDLGKRNALTRLLEKHSKLELTYQIPQKDSNRIKYGSVKILTANARRKKNTISSVMGFGGRNIFLEEASMVDDAIWEGVWRMISGKGKDVFLIKSGNPWHRNHFLKTWHDEDFKKYFIDYRIGLAEGRYQKDIIEKARKGKNFSVLYECKFPREGQEDDKGYMQLVSSKDLDKARDIVPDDARIGNPKLGVDVAREGDDRNVWVIRWQNFAEVVDVNREEDLMKTANHTILLAKRYGVKNRNIMVDDGGVGGGVTDRLKQLGYECRKVKLARSRKESKYLNRRARNFWRMERWLREKGKIHQDNSWSEISNIRYKNIYRSGREKIKIMPKDIMRSNGIPSPDIADALMLTFDTKDRVGQAEKHTQYNQSNNKNKENFDKYRPI